MKLSAGPRAILLMMGLAQLSACKAAKPPETSQWSQEPAAFLGVRLGLPLTSSLHPCDSQGGSTNPCYEMEQGPPTIENVPGYWDIRVDTLSGKVNGVTAYYDRGTGDRVAAGLVQQYGKPVEEAPTPDGTRSVWKGAHISITFYSNKDGSGFVAAGLNDHRYKPEP
jgi:hypothetical protein